MTNQDGEVVWLADYEAYGNTAKVVYKEVQLGQIQVSSEELQPIRFQGQSFDEETGLHYNRFRYFDPDLGMFTTRDPIGLLGGSNVFQYAPNPTGWIDPFGLSAKSETAKQWEERFNNLPITEQYNAAKGKLTKIATRLGLTKDNKLTKRNNREVYKTGDGRYISFDTQHGRFEVLDSKGKHLGEVDIDLNPTKPADKSGGNDNKCK